MTKEFETSVGTVLVSDVMIDTDDTNMEPGIEIASKDSTFDTFELLGYCANEITLPEIEYFLTWQIY